MGAVGVGHLERLHLRMVDGDIRALGEGDPVEPVGDREGAVAHPFEREVGAQRVLVEGELRLPHLLGVVEPVPRLELEVVAVGGDRRLQRRRLAGRDLPGGAPELPEEIVDPRRVLRHVLVEDEVGPGREAEQARGLGAEGGDLRHQRPRVALVAVAAPRRVGGEEPRRSSRFSAAARNGQRLGPWRVKTHFPRAPPAGGGGRAGDDPVGEAGEIFPLLDHQPVAVHLREQALADPHPGEANSALIARSRSRPAGASSAPPRVNRFKSPRGAGPDRVRGRAPRAPPRPSAPGRRAPRRG